MAERPPRTVLVIANSVGLPLRETGRSYLDALAERLGGGWELRRWVGTGLHIVDVAAELEARLADEGEPEQVILQLGIVESCPRPLSEAERERVDKHRSRLLRGAVILACRHFRAPIIRLRKLHQRVDIVTWREQLTAVLDRFADRPVKLLGIFPTWRRNDRQSPGYQRQIDAYNAVLAELAAGRGNVEYVPPERLLCNRAVEEILTDGIHLSPAGLEHMADCLHGLLGGVSS